MMTRTPIPRLIVTLGIPTTLSMLVTNIYNLADTAFVGRLGTSQSGAVGVVFGLMAIIQAFAFMFGQGAGSLAARSLGRRDRDKANTYASTAFFLALLTGLLITVVGLTSANWLMRILGSTETILPYAKQYSLYILLASPFMSASLCMNTMLRYEGKAAYAMIGLMSGAILNIGLDPVLMFALDLGVTGAGLSTAISQVVSFVILLSVYLSGKMQIHLSIRSFTRSGRDIFDIVTTGLPSAARQGMSSISTMLLNGMSGVYGDAAVAAMSIVNRISMFIMSVSLGIGQGFQPVSAYNYGAGKYSRVKKAYFFAAGLSECVLTALAVICFCFSAGLVQLFRDDPAVVEIGVYALRLRCISAITMPFTAMTEMLHQSTGQRVRALLLSLLRNGVIFIPLLLFLGGRFGLLGIQWTQPVSDAVTLLLNIPFAWYYLRHLPADTPEEGTAAAGVDS